LAAERIDDGSAVNLGTMERIFVADATAEILKYTNHFADIKYLPDMPTGPLNRVADNSRARAVLGWKPRVSFSGGLERTISWYWSTKDAMQVARTLPTALYER
jgi:nucleoside-diphosphate-sugar epimerase